MDSAWIVAARLLQIALAFMALGASIYVHTSTDWWGYLTKIYAFACCFLSGSTVLFGTFSLSAFRDTVPGSALVTVWIDLWAVSYFIASGVLLRMCSNISWQGGIPLMGSISAFIGAGLVTVIMLRSIFVAWKGSANKMPTAKSVFHDEE